MHFSECFMGLHLDTQQITSSPSSHLVMKRINAVFKQISCFGTITVTESISNGISYETLCRCVFFWWICDAMNAWVCHCDCLWKTWPQFLLDYNGLQINIIQYSLKTSMELSNEFPEWICKDMFNWDLKVLSHQLCTHLNIWHFFRSWCRFIAILIIRCWLWSCSFASM